MDMLSEYEMETIITFNERDKMANIYTYNVALKNKIRRYMKKNPRCGKYERINSDGSVEFILPKERLSFMFTSPYTDDHREKVKKNLKQGKCNNEYL